MLFSERRRVVTVFVSSSDDISRVPESYIALIEVISSSSASFGMTTTVWKIQDGKAIGEVGRI